MAPPIASIARRIDAPPVASRTRAARSSPSTTTTSAPIACSGSLSALRRTTLTVRMPSALASLIRLVPTPELAASWITQSPGCNAT